MAFSQSAITAVAPPVCRGQHIYLSWSSSAATGTVWYQVYLNQQLAWWGRRLSTWLPVPSGPVRIDIGTVAPGEETRSFATSLPSAPARRAQLSWSGGNFQAEDIAGFRVYSGTAPGGAVSYTTPVATIAAYPGGIMVGAGWGETTWGETGWGLSTGTYAYTSGPLAAGTWNFAVVPFDAAGNAGTGTTISQTIAAPPRAPSAPAGGGPRLTYDVAGWGEDTWGANPWGAPIVTLNWFASPS